MMTTNVNSVAFEDLQVKRPEMIEEFDRQKRTIDQEVQVMGTSKSTMSAANLIKLTFKQLVATPLNPKFEMTPMSDDMKELLVKKQALETLDKVHAEIAEKYKVYNSEAITTLVQLAEAIDAQEVIVNNKELKVIRKDGTEDLYLVDNGRILGGSKKRVLVNSNDEEGTKFFVRMDNPALLVKALKGEKITKEEIETEYKTLPFQGDIINIYKVFDFSNTQVLDTLSNETREKLRKVLSAIIDDMMGKNGGYIEYVPRMRFVELNNYNDFIVESDDLVVWDGVLFDEYPNKFILPGTKFVCKNDTLQYYYKDVPGNSYNVKNGQQTLDIPMTFAASEQSPNFEVIRQ